MTERKHGTQPICVQETVGKKAYCWCGWSEKLPYCDGTHKRLETGVSSIKVEITEPGERWICQCHQTSTPPWCDGTHEKLCPAPPPGEDS